jgi:hypothetical protein
MAQVIQLPTNTQVRPATASDQAESLVETSTPTLPMFSLEEIVGRSAFTTDDVAQHLQRLRAYWPHDDQDFHRWYTMASQHSSATSAEPTVMSQTLVVPVSDVSKFGGAIVLVVCLVSLGIWVLTGFAIINPFISILTAVGAIVFLAMGMVLQIKERET